MSYMTYELIMLYENMSTTDLSKEMCEARVQYDQNKSKFEYIKNVYQKRTCTHRNINIKRDCTKNFEQYYCNDCYKKLDERLSDSTVIERDLFIDFKKVEKYNILRCLMLLYEFRHTRR